MHKYNKLGYLLVFTIPLLFVITYYSTVPYALYLIPFLVYVIIPIIDPIIGRFNQNPSKEEIDEHKEDRYYQRILVLWVITQTFILAWLAYVFTVDNIGIARFIPMLMNTFIMTGGVGITIAHELGHKTTKLERFLSKVLLVQVCYGHFYIEHNRGHHIHVATPNDPATSKYNQSYFAFWKQTIFGSFSSALKLERQRLQQRKKPINLYNHEVWRLLILSVLWILISVSISSYIRSEFNWSLLLFWLLQSFLAFSLLEAINYIEHYGIVRKQISENQYERVNPLHSWNANFMLSNFILFQLQRHSDHHMYATKRYQLLNQYEESPQLPNGYPAMVILVLFPKLWFKVMNPLFNQWQTQQQSIKKGDE